MAHRELSFLEYWKLWKVLNTAVPSLAAGSTHCLDYFPFFNVILNVYLDMFLRINFY